MPLPVEIWSDIACPWCYVGKRRFEEALARFEHRAEVALRWRSFELDAAAPRVADAKVSYVQRLANKYRKSTAEAQAMIDAMVATGAEAGIEFRFDAIRPGNMFDAHRLQHLAAAHGKGDAAKERLFSAYFCEGRALCDHDELRRCALDLELDRAEVDSMLAGDAYGAAVRADEEAALRLRIHSVPFFVVGERHGVPGAHPPETLLEVLQTAWLERGARAQGDGPAPACGPGGCD